jgi:hypothetical protein
MDARLREMVPHGGLTYYGREESASPATGNMKLHVIEEREIVSQALEIGRNGAAKTVPMPAAKEAVKQATPVSD